MKAKRAWLAIFASVLLIVVLSLSGCEMIFGQIKGHVHIVNYDVWEKDDTAHWHICANCNDKISYAKHSYQSESATKCKVCGWPRKVEPVTPPDDNPVTPPDDNPVTPPDDNPVTPPDDNPVTPPDDNPVTPPDNPVTPSEKPTDSYIEEHSVSTYGYNWLATRTNGAQKQEMYNSLDALAKRVVRGEATFKQVDVEGTSYWTAGRAESSTLDNSDVKEAYMCYCYDHPYNFWQSQVQLTGYEYSSVSGMTNYVYLVVLDAFHNYQNLQKTRAAINENIKNLFLAADGAQNTYEIAAAYYKAIALLADYTYDSKNSPADEYWAHSIVGLLDNDAKTGPVCEGYARTLQLMLNLKGVENIYCVGYATAAGTGGGGGHSWNLVRLEDSKWYYFDLTWDDSNDANGGVGGTVSYQYFAMSKADSAFGAKFEQTHMIVPSHFMYDLPSSIATTPYSGTSFPINGTFANDEFVFLRNGMDTVAVYQIKTKSKTVSIPQSVEVNGKAYTVSEIGPYINTEGKYSSVLVNYMDTIIIGQNITAIRTAAFYCNVEITVYYTGTQEQWEKIPLGSNAFGVKYNVYFGDQWEMQNGRPTLK